MQPAYRRAASAGNPADATGLVGGTDLAWSPDRRVQARPHFVALPAGAVRQIEGLDS